MRHAAAATALLLLAGFSVTPHRAEAQVPAELAGGWLVSSWTASDGTVNESPQRGLFIFAHTGQYSIMYVTSDEPRPRFEGQTMTDAETLAAFRSLVANSGRFTVEGNTITYDAYVAKNPNYMADWNLETRANARRMTYAVRDGILTLTWLNPDGTVQGTAKLRRPSEAPAGDQP